MIIRPPSIYYSIEEHPINFVIIDFRKNWLCILSRIEYFVVKKQNVDIKFSAHDAFLE
jgi:hypothetical protein